MGRLTHVDDISEEFEELPFLDVPEGYWNQSKDGYNGFEQISIDDMSEKHKKNCIKMIQNQYIPIYRSKEYLLGLLEQKIKELEE